MTDACIARPPARLPSYALYGAVLSGAGLPIYVYAPKFFADNYGVGLASLGAVLFALRLVDVVQDPALGWLSERLGQAKGIATSIGAALLALSMLGLFAVQPPVAPLLWFAITIAGLFTAFSFLSIAFYSQGVSKAASITGGHMRVAAWRETGALLGVCTAAVTPTLLAGVAAAPFATFAIGFAAVTAVAAIAMAPEWQANARFEPVGLSTILRDVPARRLLVLALVNAMPLAVTSTLFLFFVDARLEAPGWDGPLLVLFFLAAAVSAPAWSRAAQTYGTRRTLFSAMVMAVASFACALTLGPGDTTLFAMICVASGAAIGADLTILPAAFARRMAEIAPNGGQGFGLWSLVTKLTLALAAAVLLPVLDATGFVPGSESDAPRAALVALTVLYAGLPCALKLAAIGLLAATPLEES